MKVMVRLKKITPIFVGCAVFLALTGCAGGFDAAGYTEAILDLQFQGDIRNARTLVAGSTQEELRQMYQEFVDDFVSGYITDGMDLTDTASQEFRELAAMIFASMRYEVGEAKETGKKEYEVPVVIQPTDIFLRYKELLAEDALKISEKVKNKTYKGTEEEIQDQVLAEIAGHAYELLKAAYEDSEFQEEQTVILRVKSDISDIYSIDEDDMNNLITKILRLDEIGG